MQWWSSRNDRARIFGGQSLEGSAMLQAFAVEPGASGVEGGVGSVGPQALLLADWDQNATRRLVADRRWSQLGASEYSLVGELAHEGHCPVAASCQGTVMRFQAAVLRSRAFAHGLCPQTAGVTLHLAAQFVE